MSELQLGGGVLQPRLGGPKGGEGTASKFRLAGTLLHVEEDEVLGRESRG